MREVSCRAFNLLERVALTRGISSEQLTAGLPIPLERLQNPREWMDWNVFAELCERLERLAGAESCIAVGRAAVEHDVMRPMQRIARVLVSLPQLYRLTMVWLLPLVQRAVSAEVLHDGPDRLRIEVSIPPHLRDAQSWFLMVEGGLSRLPTLCDYGPAQVTSERRSRHCTLRVQLPPARVRPLSLLRRAVSGGALNEVERQVAELRLLEAERSRADEQLRDRERMLTNLITNLSGMVYRLRGAADGDLISASEGCLSLTGYRPDELVESRATSLAALVHPDDAALFAAHRRACMEAGHARSAEYRIRTRAGAPRWVLDVAQATYDSGGRPSGSEGFLIDVTERRRLEEELNHSLRVESIGRLAGGIAHDFNNLLTVILGCTELAMTRLAEPDPARSLIGQIDAAASRAAALTRQLLAFARKQVVAPRVVDLNGLVMGLHDLLRRSLGEQIDLATLPAPSLWPVEVDPSQFEQVLVNLAVNARDAMPEGGRLTIETANIVVDQAVHAVTGLALGPYVQLTVTDTGLGMSDEVRAHAFEPFFTTKGVGKGTGLGLPSAHGIVQQARGHMFLTSGPGRGTQIKIYLPRASGVVAQPALKAAGTPTRGGRETILLVEDHDMLRDMARGALEAQGYRVLAASGGPEALAVSQQHAGELDLLLTDVVMPHMSGRQLAEKLTAERPDLPVLFVSGYAEENVMREHIVPSETTFLAKPFSSSALGDKVRELLDRAASRRTAERRQGGQKLRIVH